MYFRYFVIIFPWKRLNWPSGSGEENYKISSMSFRYDLPLGKEKALYLKKLEFPSANSRILCIRLGWNWPSGSWEKDFSISSMYFRYFVIISPWKKVGPSIWIHFNPHYPKMRCAKFGWNWSSGSGKKRWKWEKFTDRRTEEQTDGQRTAGIRKAHLSFQLR